MKLKQIRVDGYKNLIDVKIDIHDFNVLVGPNNSGKSNVLEALQMLWPICFGDDKFRGHVFRGACPPSREGNSICHLIKYEGRPLSIGVTFEIIINGDLWSVDYDVKIQTIHQARKSDEDDAHFISEKLTAKIPGTPGPAKTYINRTEETIEVLKVEKKEEKKISKKNSSLLAINSLYPDYEHLPLEFKQFSWALKVLGNTNVFAFSPIALRRDLQKETSMNSFHLSSFDLLPVIENIKNDPEKYSVFENAICEILELENVYFEKHTFDIPAKEGAAPTKKDFRFFLLKCPGSKPSVIDEFSDGTLLVVAVLASVLSSDLNTSPVLCLEELENCLHPNAVERLLDFLQNYSDRQPVIITTHSPYVLNCLNNYDDLNVAIVDEDGATRFEKIQDIHKLRQRLNSGLLNFGELLPSNFSEYLKKG